MAVTIKDLPKSSRPRERLIDNGVEALSDEELLSIILKTGTNNHSVKDLSFYILNSVKSIHDLMHIDYNDLIKIKGIGEAKACTILATIELGRRIFKEVEEIKGTKFNSPYKVFQYYQNKFIGLPQEFFYCIYLDNHQKILSDKKLFMGSLNYSMVHPREVFKQAYLTGASFIICIHNHPSGNPLPSKEDIELTNNLIKVGNLLGVKVLDHIIIGSNNYYSFLENGDINNGK
jgi:DNA repair protein RadC